MQNKNLLGITLIFFYCVTSAVSLILVNHYEQNFNPIKLTFYNFLFATLFFIVLSVTKLLQTAQKIRQTPRFVLMINIATILAWLPAFYSLKYLDPVIVIGIIFGVIPITSILLNLATQNFVITKQDLFFSLLTALMIALIIGHTLLTATISSYHLYFSLAGAITAGAGTAWGIRYMKVLSTTGFSAIQVITVRFLLLVAITALLIHYLHLSFSLNFNQILEIILIAGLSVVIPVIFFQKGVENTTPLNIAFIMPLQPVITYTIQFAEGKLQNSLTTFILIALLSLTILTSAFCKSRKIYQERTS